MNEKCAVFDNNVVSCYGKFYKPLIGYLMSFVFNVHDAEELAQDVFVRVYEKGRGMDPESSSVKNFIFTVARNRAIDFIKKKRIEKLKYSEARFEDVVMNRQFYRDIEDMYIEGEILSTVNNTINSFPKKERDVFLEKVFNGTTGNEIIKKTKLTPYKVRKIEHMVNSRIRDNIMPYTSGSD